MTIVAIGCFDFEISLAPCDIFLSSDWKLRLKHALSVTRRIDDSDLILK